MILNNAQPIHWGWIGLVIGAVALFMLYFLNTRFGISTGLEDLCAIVSKRPFFRRKPKMGLRSWRVPFLLGLVLGGAISAVWTGGWSPMWELGMLDAATGWGPGAKVAWTFAGGFLIGFGTRLYLIRLRLIIAILPRKSHRRCSINCRKPKRGL